MKTLSLTEKAYTEIRNRIVRHIIKPGALLSTKELAQTLGMSMTPVREALCILEHEHFAKCLPKRGYAVNTMNTREFVDIYDLRLAIEALAVEQATERINPEDQQRMELLVSDSDKSKSNIMAVEQEFHTIILKATGNRLLEQTGRRILDRIWMVQKIVLHNSEHWSESTRDHREIYQAIVQKDSVRAVIIMKKHLLWGKQLVLSRLKDGDDFLFSFFSNP